MSNPITLQVDIKAALVTAMMRAAERTAHQYGLTVAKNLPASLGPFSVSLTGSGSPHPDTGTFALHPPNILGIHDLVMDLSLETDLSVNLGDFITSRHSLVPAVSANSTSVSRVSSFSWGDITAPFQNVVDEVAEAAKQAAEAAKQAAEQIYKEAHDFINNLVHIGRVNIPIHFTISVPITGDCRLTSQSEGSTWVIKLGVVDALQIPTAPAQAFLEALEAALHSGLSSIPGIGNFLQGIVNIILDKIGVSGALDALTKLVTEIVDGFPLYTVDRKHAIVHHMDIAVPPNVVASVSKIPVDVEFDVEVLNLSASVSADSQFLALGGAVTAIMNISTLGLSLQVSGAEQVTIATG